MKLKIKSFNLLTYLKHQNSRDHYQDTSNLKRILSEMKYVPMSKSILPFKSKVIS